MSKRVKNRKGKLPLKSKKSTKAQRMMAKAVHNQIVATK